MPRHSPGRSRQARACGLTSSPPGRNGATRTGAAGRYRGAGSWRGSRARGSRPRYSSRSAAVSRISLRAPEGVTVAHARGDDAARSRLRRSAERIRPVRRRYGALGTHANGIAMFPEVVRTASVARDELSMSCAQRPGPGCQTQSECRRMWGTLSRSRRGRTRRNP